MRDKVKYIVLLGIIVIKIVHKYIGNQYIQIYWELVYTNILGISIYKYVLGISKYNYIENQCIQIYWELVYTNILGISIM